jgi:cation-transporting ATPase 13A3/4/5
VFQILSIILWSVDDYLFYAIIIAVILIVTLIIDIVDIRARTRKLRNLATSKTVVTVYRNGATLVVESDELVPGDLI